MLAVHGWKVLDGGSHTSANYQKIPVIVYDNSTAATVNTVRSLLKKRKVPPHMLCAMLDQNEGQADLNRVARELGCAGKVSSICSAVIYDYLFQSARLLLRKGFEYEQIQKFFDYELNRIGSVEENRGDEGSGSEKVEIVENESDAADFFHLKFGGSEKGT